MLYLIYMEKRNKHVPKVSIVMAAFNSERFIQQAVASALSQDFKDFELIIVNDGSTDRTGYISNELAKQDERIIVIHQENKGVVSSRNTAIENSSGIYIAILDSDDEWLPGKLTTQVGIFEKNPSLVVVGGGYELTNNMGINIGSELLMSSDEDIRRGMTIYSQFGHSSVLYKRDAAIKAGLYPNTCPVEDYDFMFRLMKLGEAFNVPYPLYRYRTETGGISDSAKNTQINLSKKLSLEIWNEFKPRIYTKKQIINLSNEYLNNSIHKDLGIKARYIFLSINSRVGYRMIKRGDKVRGIRQVLNIATSSLDGFRITRIHGREIIKSFTKRRTE